jgi:site-specific recombinase XerD
MVNAPEYYAQCSKVLGIPFAKSIKKPPACLSQEAVKLLLNIVNASTDEGLRHLAILALMYDSGCRVQELINLNVTDFQGGHCSRIYVHGKGNKFRSIPLLNETEKIITRYIKCYKLPADAPLFMNSKGERLTRQGVRYITKKYSSKVNLENPNCIDGSMYPHRLRHSKATHLVNEGVNIYNVRDFLGHESVSTTQVYLTSNPEITRKAIENAAAKTVPDSTAYYAEDQKAELLAFLETLK